MMWLAFSAGVLGLCAALVLGAVALRRTKSANAALRQQLIGGHGYPEFGGFGPSLAMVVSVGAAVISGLVAVYSLGHLDSAGAPSNLLGGAAFSGSAPRPNNAPTGPLKLPRRSSVAEVAHD